MNIRQLIYPAVLLAAITTSLSGQSTAPAAQDAVVAEIRALRADLNQQLEASIRAQMVVARLSLQEQRTNTVFRQLQDVRDKLHANEAMRVQLETSLKMFGGDKPRDKDEKDAMALVIEPLKAQVEAATKAHAELSLELSDLTNQLAQEQARWNGFNRLLDDLEASLSKPRRR